MLARADAVPEQNEAHAVSTMMSAIEQRVNDIYSDIEVYTTHVRLLQAGVKCGHRCATAWCLAQAHTGTFCARIKVLRNAMHGSGGARHVHVLC